MSSSRGPYQSRLFSNLNRQSQRLRDRLGETVRHLKVAAEWGVQALIYPLYWLLHPQKWLGPVLGAGQSSQKAALPSRNNHHQAPHLGTQSLASDGPIETVLASLQPWFDNAQMGDDHSLILSENFLAAISLEFSPSPADHNYPRKNKVLPAQPDFPALPAVSAPSLLTKLGDQVKSIFQSSPDEIVIQGLASRCDDHCLVLTTSENLTLDVFSLDQQLQLQQQIRQELGKWHYHRRQQWALETKQWRSIPLISKVVSKEETPKVIAPLDWIWQGIYRWQTRPALPTLFQSVTAIISPNSSPPNLNGLKGWLGQTATSLGHQPVIEATVVKSQQLSQQIVTTVPPTLQHLSQDLQQKLSQLFSGENYPQQTTDPFELKVILQAAIAYFFGGKTYNLALENGHSPALPGENQSPWLAWEDLFSGLPTPPLVTPLLPKVSADQSDQANGSEPWTEESLETPHCPSNFSLAHSPRNVPMVIPQRYATRCAAGANPVLVDNHQSSWRSGIVDDPWQERSLEYPRTNRPRKNSPRQLNSTKEIIRNPRQEQDLETAFDWIEAKAQSLGYDKHILVWCLEWLDRLVYWLEQGIEKIWHWLQKIFGEAESTD